MIATTTMISGKYKQFIFENDASIRLIEYIKQENTFFKNRLSEVTSQIHDKKEIDSITSSMISKKNQKSGES